MPEILEFTIKPLTPLFTGGIEGKCDYLHESGLIGSLRWWFEVLVRGMGGYACDPSAHDCKDGKYCDACAVFGATGLKRAFNLRSCFKDNKDNKDFRLNAKIKNNRGWYLLRGLKEDICGTVIIPFQSLLNTNISANELKELLTVSLLIASEWGGLGAKVQQGYGSAILDIPLHDSFQLNEIMKKLYHRSNRREPQNQDLPRLDQFFFRKVRFNWDGDKGKLSTIFNKRVTIDSHERWPFKPEKNIDWYLEHKIVPLAPLLRYHLRALVRENIQYKFKDRQGNYLEHPNAATRWKLMGVLNGCYHCNDYGKIVKEWVCLSCNKTWDHKPKFSEHSDCKGKTKIQWKCTTCGMTWEKDPIKVKQAKKVVRWKSLINVSHAYLLNNGQWEFRIWGWIPPILYGDVQRKTVIELLKKWTAQKGELWKRCELEPDSNYNMWIDMIEGNIEENIKKLITMRGGENI